MLIGKKANNNLLLFTKTDSLTSPSAERKIPSPTELLRILHDHMHYRHTNLKRKR
jgi:hypothetical protein